jgi:hypothetical protein
LILTDVTAFSCRVSLKVVYQGLYKAERLELTRESGISCTTSGGDKRGLRLRARTEAKQITVFRRCPLYKGAAQGEQALRSRTPHNGGVQKSY